MMKLLILSITMIAGIFCSCQARADIYRFEGDDEIVSFSDTPSDKRYLLVMKEQQHPVEKNGKGKNPAGVKKEENPLRPPFEQNGSLGKYLPIQGVITSLSGLRADPFDGRLKHHNGLDIAAPSGTPVKPVAPGKVIYSGWKSGYGNTVILDHQGGMVTVYAHHSINNVVAGETVDLNSVIALTGSTGRSTGPHLHFEAWQDGANITAEFVPTGSPVRPSTRVARDTVRRLLQDDGTILFTNLR